MKNTFILPLVIISQMVFSQVEINTPSPKSSLHINGDMTLTSALNVGGNANTAGNSGNKNDLLQS